MVYVANIIVGYDGTPQSERAADRAVLEAISRGVAAVHPSLEIQGTVSRGPAYSALNEAADRDEMIVVGATAPGSSGSTARKSTPARLMRHAMCPVLVVPPKCAPRPRRLVVGIDGSEDADRAMLWTAEEAERMAVELVVVHVREQAGATVVVEMLIEQPPVPAVLGVASGMTSS